MHGTWVNPTTLIADSFNKGNGVLYEELPSIFLDNADYRYSIRHNFSYQPDLLAAVECNGSSS